MITAEQKLIALDIKYHTAFEWIPKEGDYYTIFRNDDEVFQIISMTATEIIIQQVGTDQKTIFTKDDFFSDFHENRVYLHPSVWQPPAKKEDER